MCVGKSWYGPGFTPTEQASQVSLWAVLASPLIVSFDVRNMPPGCKELVTNPRVIAVHQDKLGKPGKRLLNSPNTNETSLSSDGSIGAQVWGRPLAGGGVAAAFFNRGESARDISASFGELGLVVRQSETVQSVDVWTGAVTRVASSLFVARAVPAHAVVFVTLTPQ